MKKCYFVGKITRYFLPKFFGFSTDENSEFMAQ